MKKLISILMVLISFGAMAQDGHIIYNDHSNYKMYGRDVLVRTDATNLDTLTSVYNGSIAFDTSINHFVGYDKSEWSPIAYGRVKDTIVTVSSASILNINSSPVTIISAPGSGYATHVMSADVKVIFNSVAYTTAGTLIIGSSSASGYQLISNDILTATSAVISSFDVVQGFQLGNIVENDNIIVTSNVSNPATGNSDIKIYLRYQIIEL